MTATQIAGCDLAEVADARLTNLVTRGWAIGWGPRKAKAGMAARFGDQLLAVTRVLWVDRDSEPKRARVMVKPVSGTPCGPEIELCSCRGCAAMDGLCRVRDGEPDWHEHMALAGSGPQGPEYARREQRRRDKTSKRRVDLTKE